LFVVSNLGSDGPETNSSYGWKTSLVQQFPEYIYKSIRLFVWLILVPKRVSKIN
jgi:hypothetical protein